MDSEMKCWTKLTVQVKPPDEEPYERSITEPKWDCDMVDMVFMFRSLLAAMGFNEQAINEYFEEV